MSTPIKNDPVTLIRKVPSGKSPEYHLATNVPIMKRETAPSAPPSMTNRYLDRDSSSKTKMRRSHQPQGAIYGEPHRRSQNSACQQLITFVNPKSERRGSLITEVTES